MKIIYSIILFTILPNFVFGQDLYPVKKDHKWGYINKLGKLIVPFKYDTALAFSDGLASVCENKKYGFINKNGILVIPHIFNGAYHFKNGICRVIQDDSHLIIDREGNILMSSSLDKKVYITENGLIEVKDQDSIFIYNSTLLLIYSDNKIDYNSQDIYNNRLRINRKNKYGYVDSLGNNVIDVIYEKAYPFIDDLAAVQKDNKYGFIDKNGKVILPFIYDIAVSFQHGFAIVGKKIKDKEEFTYQIINKLGEVIVEDDFVNIRDYNFDLGIIFVSKKIFNNKYKFAIYDIKKQGIIGQTYDDLFFLNYNNDLILGFQEDKQYVMSREGEILLDTSQFDDIGDIFNTMDGGLIPIFIDGDKYSIYNNEGNTKIGYINTDGVIVWKPQN